MKKVLVALAVFAGILVAAAACGGSSAVSTANKPSGVQSGGSTGAISVAPGTGVPGPNVPGTTTNPNGPLLPAIQGPQVIRQAQLSITISAGSFETKLSSLHDLITLEQGYISGTDAQADPITNDQIRTGVITFMVPAAKFDETIDALTRLGRLQNEHISGNDVSGQYVDLQARLANEEAQRDAMIALLQKAQTVEQIIAVQNQLGEITGQIEELKGEIRYIDQNTAFSTITVTLAEAGAPAAVPNTDSWGFVSALSDAAHNFVTTINYLIAGLGAIGPVVLLLGLGYLVWRRSGSPWLRRA